MRRPDLRRLAASLATRLPKSLTTQSPRDHRDPDEVFQRRRRVVAAFSVAGAGLLGASLSTKPGSPRFYVLTLGVAATWVTGGFASGPLHLGRTVSRDQRLRRPVLTPVVTGVAAFGFFYGCALVCTRIPLLRHAIARILTFADEGATPLVALTACANAVAEEVFFRGALYAAIGEGRQVAVSTGVYTVATVATRNPALVLAAAAMGGLFGLQRRATGGIQAPILTHLTWSVLMLRYLPPLFRQGHDTIPTASLS